MSIRSFWGVFPLILPACADPGEAETPGDPTPTTSAPACDAPLGPWTEVDLPSNREGMGIGTLDDHVYVVGGWTPGAATSEVWIGTVDGDAISWADGPPLPDAIEHPSAGLTGGRFWFLGGDDDAGAIRTDVFSAEVDGASVGPWQTGEPLAEPVTWAASARWDDHLFFVGGTSDFDAARTDVVRLDPGEGAAYTLVPQTPLPEGRFATAATATNGFLYVAGGATDFYKATDTVWRAPIVDGELGEWEDLATLEYDVILPALAVAGDTLLVAGGARSWVFEEDHVFQVSLDDGEVKHAKRLPEPRLGQGVAVVGDRWILVGGWSDLSGVMHDTAAVTTLCAPT